MTILIAEDDPNTSLFFRKSLESLGEEVVLAKDGEEAWHLIQSRKDVRIVIADWMMPGVEGPELCRRIRELVDEPYVYFILITARSFQADRLTGLRAGADDYLEKPIDTAELVARVNVARRLLATQDELRKRTAELERLHLELRWQNAQLAELATRDGLTGLKNQRYFRATLDSAVAFANRKGLPLSLIMLDIDHFKSYNDSFGHPAGDEVLIAIGRTLSEMLRDHDLVARTGGEEFVVLLPATDVSAARTVAERLRIAIASRSWPNRAIRASFGVATTGPKVATPSKLIELADRALYRAKALGRDQTSHADDLDTSKSDLNKVVTILFPTPES